MKKIFLSLAIISGIFTQAKAGTAISINATSLSSSASLEVVVYAYDLTTLSIVGQTAPIAVSNLSGLITIDEEEIEWDGPAPSGDWGWDYAEIKVSCSTPSTALTTQPCGSLHLDGVTINPAVDETPASDCFKVVTSTCSDGVGSSVDAVVQMGNDNSERPSYPALVEIQ